VTVNASEKLVVNRVARWCIFKPKNPKLGKFCRVSEWKMLVYSLFICNMYFTVIWYNLWPFGNVMVHWYIFSPFWYIVSRKIWQHWSSDVGVGGKNPPSNAKEVEAISSLPFFPQKFFFCRNKKNRRRLASDCA
jgi:hypothetical protein